MRTLTTATGYFAMRRQVPKSQVITVRHDWPKRWLRGKTDRPGSVPARETRGSGSSGSGYQGRWLKPGTASGRCSGEVTCAIRKFA